MAKIEFNPYFFFRGECKDAMEFYKKIFGGKLDLVEYKDYGMEDPEGMKNAIMHAYLSGDLVTIMASDTAQASLTTAKICMSLSGDDEEKLTEIYNLLNKDSKDSAPLKKEVWGDIYGTVTDKFGIEWMINIAPKK